MTVYSFSGKLRMGDRWQKFEREIEADSEEYAKEKVLSQLGSEHNVPRGNIELSE